MSKIATSITGIKSIQRGATAANTSATITAVDTSKSVLYHLGTSCTSGVAYTGDFARAVLTNSTTITFTCGSASNSPVVGWQLVEYY